MFMHGNTAWVNEGYEEKNDLGLVNNHLRITVKQHKCKC